MCIYVCSFVVFLRDKREPCLNIDSFFMLFIFFLSRGERKMGIKRVVSNYIRSFGPGAMSRNNSIHLQFIKRIQALAVIYIKPRGRNIIISNAVRVLDHDEWPTVICLDGGVKSN